MFAKAHVMGCSTGGQIRNDDVDDEIAAVALRFDRTRLGLACEAVPAPAHSRACGEAIGRSACGRRPRRHLCFVRRPQRQRQRTGGGHHRRDRSEDSADRRSRRRRRQVRGNTGRRRWRAEAAARSPRSGSTASSIRIGHGSAGGWDEFGPRRRITRSTGNVLYELDGEPALDLYERYLGEEDARGLPGTALLFPLLIRDLDRPDQDVVRTVLAVDRQARSMTFAGDMPEGWVAQLMRGNFDRLAGGAADAARQARSGLGVGRRPERSRLAGELHRPPPADGPAHHR